MDLSLKNYRKKLSPAVLKKATTNTVRECDEIDKGHFQAFVDAGKDSFDVSIHIDHQGNITEHHCDCTIKNGFCIHKTALLVMLDSGRSATHSSIKSKKKILPFENTLESVTTEQLRNWVHALLSQNKDLALSFVHQFTETPAEQTPENIKQLTWNAVKAVIKNKRNLEANEVKKIVELWTKIHEPIIESYCMHPGKESEFLNIDALFKTCADVLEKMNTSSTRFRKYLGNLEQKVVSAILRLTDEEEWYKATGFFIDTLHNDLRSHTPSYFSLLVSIFNETNIERKRFVTVNLVEMYERFKKEELYLIPTFTTALFSMTIETGIFFRHYHLFKPIRFNNDYNEELIYLLIQMGRLELAEQYCLEQIKGNFREEYDRLYQEILLGIYTRQQNEEKMLALIKELLPTTFNFTHYQWAYERIKDDTERKNWRTKLLTRARHIATYTPSAVYFSFLMMAHENNYKRMIEYIDTNSPFALITEYADAMARTDKQLFLQQLIFKPVRFTEKEEGETYYPKLHAILLQHYSGAELNFVLQQVETKFRNFSPNGFVKYLKEKR